MYLRGNTLVDGLGQRVEKPLNSQANYTPVAREVQALADIEQATGIRPAFFGYNSPLFESATPIIEIPETIPEEIPIDPIP